MGKKAFLRGLLGFPLGMAVGYLISILISLWWGEGHYMPCTPALLEAVGSETAAVAAQAALCGLLGASFAACSLIWELERWSIMKQSGVYFAITALIMMPVAYLANWMEHSLGGFLGYLGVFTFIFAAVWIAQYLLWRRRVWRMDRRVRNGRRE